MVVLCPDTGRNYLSKFYDDAWLAENSLLDAEPVTRPSAICSRIRGPRTLVTVGPEATAAEAVELMQVTRDLAASRCSATARPVGQHPGSHAGPAACTTASTRGRSASEDVMARPLPQVDVRVHLDEAYRLLLAGNSGVLATRRRRGRRHRHADRPDPRTGIASGAIDATGRTGPLTGG